MQVQEQTVFHMKAPVLSVMKAPHHLPVKRNEEYKSVTPRAKQGLGRTTICQTQQMPKESHVCQAKTCL